MSSYFVSGKSINHPSYVNLPWIHCIIKFPILIDILKKFSFKNPFFIPANVYVSVLSNQLHVLNAWMYSTEISCYQLSALHHTSSSLKRWSDEMRDVERWDANLDQTPDIQPGNTTIIIIMRYDHQISILCNCNWHWECIFIFTNGWSLQVTRTQVESRRLAKRQF